MTGLPTYVVISLALCLCWMLGGIALRLGGALAFWAGLVGLLATGAADALLLALVGGLAWLLGQGHHLLRRGYVRSPLARAILGTLSGLVGHGDRS